MRVNFFDIEADRLKIIYKVLSVFLALCITAVALLFMVRWVSKKYLYPIKYNEYVENFASIYQLDENMVYAVIKIESNFNEKAESKKGAKGLMQIMDSTAEYIAKEKGIVGFDIFDPKTNIEFGCYYLRYLLDKFSVKETAIIAYNAGEGTVRGWLKNSQYSTDGKTLKTIPFKETREYIKKFQKSFSKYQNLY